MDRTDGIVAALVVLSAFAGCSALGGGSGSGCGPGDVEINNIDSDTGQVILEGTVEETGQASFNLDDGSGLAFIMASNPDVESGDCVVVEGRTQTGGMGSDADVTVVASNVTSA